MHYLFDACAARGNLRGQIRQSAGPIADDSGETREPSIGDKAAFDDPAQDIGINISATKEKDDAFTGETTKIAGQACGQRSGGSPFNYALLQLYDAQNRKRDLFLADDDSSINARLRALARIFADLRNKQNHCPRRLPFGPR